MTTRQVHAVLTIGMLSLAAGAAAASAEVYRWVDEEGVVHFSQWAPDEMGLEVTRMEVETSNPEDYHPHEDPYSILNQSARIHDRWIDLQAARDEPQQQLAADAVSLRETDDYYFPAFRFGQFARFTNRDPFLVPRRQLRVLDEFERLPIPHARSINSSWHHARIAAKQQVVRNAIRQGGH